jgi:hypothetical protein
VREREGGRTEVHVYAAREELADHLDDVCPAHAQLAGEGEPLGDVLGGQHGAVHALFEEAQLGALGDGVAHGELDHVVSALQGDHVVVDARARYLRVVLEVELLRLEVALGERPRGDLDARVVDAEGQVGEDVLFLLLGEVPEDDHAVAEDEHLAEREGVGRHAPGLRVGVAAVTAGGAGGVGQEAGGLVRGLVVVAHKIGLLVAKITLVVVAGLVALDLFVEHRLAARRLEGRTAAHAVAVAARQERQVVDAVQAVVVELGAGIVGVLDEGGGALHLVGLRGAVGRDARQLVRPAGFGQALCVALVGRPSLAAAELGVGRRPRVLSPIELALLVLVVLVGLGQQHQLLAELAGARRHVRRNQAAGQLGVERMATTGRAAVVGRAGGRRPATLLRGDVRGILQDVVDADQTCPRCLSLQRRRRALLLAGSRVPRVGHEHRRPSLALRRGCAHRGLPSSMAKGRLYRGCGAAAAAVASVKFGRNDVRIGTTCSPATARLHMPTALSAIGRYCYSHSNQACSLTKDFRSNTGVSYWCSFTQTIYKSDRTPCSRYMVLLSPATRLQPNKRNRTHRKTSGHVRDSDCRHSPLLGPMRPIRK